MSTSCDQAMEAASAGVGATLRAVDCSANEMAAATFGRLFASGGALGPSLTLILGIFVVLFGFSLILGRTNLSVKSLVPKMMTLGLVLTFATSWLAYQSVVWNLAIGAPDWLAGILTGTTGSATHVFGDKIDVVMSAVEQATLGHEGAPTQADRENISAFSPKGMVWFGAMLLLLGTVGVLVTARIGLAVLVALGPVFVVMALFNGTRGLFTGWLKGIVMLALTPLFAVLSGGLMLELAVPVLNRLSTTPGEVDPRAAVAFFLLGAVHMALMIMVLKTLANMVSGWRVFGLVPDEKGKGRRDVVADRGQSAPVPHGASASGAAYQSTAQAAGLSNPPRRIDVSGGNTAPAANDSSGNADQPARPQRTVPVYATTAGGEGQAQPAKNSLSRAKGIGSRFRPTNIRTAGGMK